MKRHESLIRLGGPRQVWLVPQSSPCAGGCGVRIEPAEARLRIVVGGRNRDYHRACAERLGVRISR